MRTRQSVTIATLFTLFTLVPFAGCGPVTTGSGDLVTESFDYKDFTRVEAHNGFEVEIRQSTSFSIEVTIDDNLQEYLDVTKSGGTLIIELTGNRVYSSVIMAAKVTMPDIEGINLSGGSQAEIKSFSSSLDFSVTLSEGSGLEGSIRTGDAGFGLSGGSIVTLSGSAKDLVIRSTGGSRATLNSFPVNNADINIDGGGSASIDMNGTLNMDLTGGSKVVYSGEAEMGDISLSGGSIFEKQ